MRDLLRGYATAILESATTAGRARQVASELDAFSRALTDSDPLRNVLTDVAIPARARRGVVHDLLEAKGCRRVPGPRLLGGAGGERRRVPGRGAGAGRARPRDGRRRRDGRGPTRPAGGASRGQDRGPRADPRLRRQIVPRGRAARAHRRDRGRAGPSSRGSSSRAVDCARRSGIRPEPSRSAWRLSTTSAGKGAAGDGPSRRVRDQGRPHPGPRGNPRMGRGTRRRRAGAARGQGAFGRRARRRRVLEARGGTRAHSGPCRRGPGAGRARRCSAGWP